MYIGMSSTWARASASAFFNAARSLVPGAYDNTGSFFGMGKLKNPVDIKEMLDVRC
jgi:hypothetical protein